MGISYRALTAALAGAGIDEPAEEACLLLSHFCGATRATLLCDPTGEFDSPDLDAALTRRLTREPLQYILGEWDFCGCSFTVNPHCLIPRPDTEVLVEEAVRLLPQGGRFIDLCTGSGCIAVATLYHRPDTCGIALELDPDTLALATQNAKDNGVDNRFTPVRADLLAGVPVPLAEAAPYDAILSNPPYIRRAEIAALSPEVGHEPFIALDGGEDGLVFYRAILKEYSPLVRPGGYILLEIGYDQAEDLQALTAEVLPHASFRVIRDLGGRDRVVVIRIP